MNIIDLHCDTLLKLKNNNYTITENDGHITDNGLKLGGYLAQCFAIYTSQKINGEDAYSYFKNQYMIFDNMVNNSKILKKAIDARSIINNSKNSKVSAVLTVENAEFLNGKLSRISELQKCRVKILGLIHNVENCLAFPHTYENLPLKEFGKEVVDALNYTDILVDVSHLNFGGFNNVKVLSKKPFIATHSACRELCEHTRNLYDSQINDIANSGGIIGVPFYSLFLNGTNSTAILDIVTHLEHLIKIGGEDVAAIGTDFDGMNCNLFLKNSSGMHILADALIKKFGINLTEKICYKNALRVLG